MKSTAISLTVTPMAAATGVAFSFPALSDYGTSWPVVMAAVFGAITAIPELPQKTKAGVAAAALIALAAGALGGPIASQIIAEKYGFAHAAAPLLSAVMISHFAHDLFRPFMSFLMRYAGGKK